LMTTVGILGINATKNWGCGCSRLPAISPVPQICVVSVFSCSDGGRNFAR
jgi:hypothetical protein